MLRLFSLMLFVALVFGACAVASDSGGASEPVMVPAVVTTEAGSNALSVAAIDAETCGGVLVPVTGRLSLETQALTDTVTGSQPRIVSMCSAIYETGEVGGEFLTIALMQFDSNDSAIDHYELMKGVFVESDVPISEINNSAEGLIDQVSGLMDRDGIGRTTVMRQREWVLSISVGPTMAEAPWVVGDMEVIGRGVLGRVE